MSAARDRERERERKMGEGGREKWVAGCQPKGERRLLHRDTQRRPAALLIGAGGEVSIFLSGRGYRAAIYCQFLSRSSLTYIYRLLSRVYMLVSTWFPALRR